MTDEQMEALKEFIHARYQKSDAMHAETHRRLDELTVRVGQLDQNIAGLRRDVALLHEVAATQGVRMDGIDRRIDRIERRMDLTEETAR